jgi:RNA polymerase sigma-70 factor (ECF subfamily)
MDEERDRRWSSWMCAAQSGDAASYEKLLLELLPALRGFVARRVSDPSAVEDVVQNVFVSMHRSRHTYHPDRPFRPWIYAIARNAAVDHLRAKGRRAGREQELDLERATPVESEPAPASAADMSAELVAALETLPPRQREAVWMLQVEDLSVSEAASRVGITKSALKVRAHRGYRALRAKLGAIGGREPEG